MQKVMVALNDANDLKWPRKCSGCGTNVTEKATNTFNIDVEKDGRALFSGLTPTTLPAKLCDACSRRMSKYAFLANNQAIYWGLLILAFVWFAFGWLQDSPVLKESFALYIVLATVSFAYLTFLLLQKLNEIRRKRIIGIRCIRRSKDRWTFWFRNDLFRAEFTALNAHSK